jgi:hypothetical protein
MKITIDFDLGTLSDRVLNLLLRGAGEGEGPRPQLVREIADVMARELLMRQSGRPWPVRKQFSIECGMEPGDVEAIADALHSLTCDVVSLEKAATLAPAGSLERAELGEAAHFLFRVGESVAGLSGAAISA